MQRVSGRTVLVVALVAGLSACGAPKDEVPAAESETVAAQASEPAAVAAQSGPALAANAAPASFTVCKTCHSVEPGHNMIGPSLAGVFGRTSATVPGYAYSPAAKTANLIWDEATLDTYLTAPMKLVPGTKMTFAGYADAARRKEVIDYLKTVK